MWTTVFPGWLLSKLSPDSYRKDVLSILEGRIAHSIHPIFLEKVEPQDHGAIQRPLLLVEIQSHQKGRHHTVMCSQKRDSVTRIWQRVQDFLRRWSASAMTRARNRGQLPSTKTAWSRDNFMNWGKKHLFKRNRQVGPKSSPDRAIN